MPRNKRLKLASRLSRLEIPIAEAADCSSQTTHVPNTSKQQNGITSAALANCKRAIHASQSQPSQTSPSEILRNKRLQRSLKGSERSEPANLDDQSSKCDSPLEVHFFHVLSNMSAKYIAFFFAGSLRQAQI